MTIYILESPDGSERAITRSRDGYDGWALLGESSRMPKEDEDWDREAGHWKTDAERRSRRERLAEIRNPEKLAARIEALENRLAKLEAQQETTP